MADRFTTWRANVSMDLELGFWVRLDRRVGKMERVFGKVKKEILDLGSRRKLINESFFN